MKRHGFSENAYNGFEKGWKLGEGKAIPRLRVVIQKAKSGWRSSFIGRLNAIFVDRKVKSGV